MPLIVTALGVPLTSGALPIIIFALVEIAVFAHVEVVPQADIAGKLPATRVPPAEPSPCVTLRAVPLEVSRTFVLASEPKVKAEKVVPTLVWRFKRPSAPESILLRPAKMNALPDAVWIFPAMFV